LQLIFRLLTILAMAMLPGGGLILVGLWMLRVKRVIPVEGGSHLYPLAGWHRYAKARHPIRYWLTETLPTRIFRRKEASS